MLRYQQRDDLVAERNLVAQLVGSAERSKRPGQQMRQVLREDSVRLALVQRLDARAQVAAERAEPGAQLQVDDLLVQPFWQVARVRAVGHGVMCSIRAGTTDEHGSGSGLRPEPDRLARLP